MKKKILISTVVIIMTLSMSLMIFVGCDKPYVDDGLGIGSIMATDDMVEGGIKPINKNMSAFEMLQVGMENFYNAKYAIIEYNGGVNMNLGIKVDQTVQSTKVRKGLGDAAGNNANGATYFADNKSYSDFAKIYERFVITPDSFTRRSGNKDKIKFDKPSEKTGRLGRWTVNKWNEPNVYGSLDELVSANSNNPTILWMYELEEDYVLEEGSTAPEYDKETRTYKFTLNFEPEKSTVEYLKVMQVQLEKNAGMRVEGLGFNALSLEIVMWDNGMIRAINVVEKYKMKMVLFWDVGINGEVKLTATQLFSYDPEEELYKIDELIEKFDNNTI